MITNPFNLNKNFSSSCIRLEKNLNRVTFKMLFFEARSGSGFLVFDNFSRGISKVTDC